MTPFDIFIIAVTSFFVGYFNGKSGKTETKVVDHYPSVYHDFRREEAMQREIHQLRHDYHRAMQELHEYRYLMGSGMYAMPRYCPCGRNCPLYQDFNRCSAHFACQREMVYPDLGMAKPMSDLADIHSMSKDMNHKVDKILNRVITS